MMGGVDAEIDTDGTSRMAASTNRSRVKDACDACPIRATDCRLFL